MGFVNPASPGWGLGWLCLGTVCGVAPLVSAVCGVRGWGSVSACLWDVCGCVGSPLAPRCFRFWRAVFFFLGVPVSGLVVPVPPSPFFRAGLLALFFFSFFLLVSVSLLPVGRCSWLGVAGFGWVVPLCLFGGPVFGAFWGGGFGRLWWCWRAVWRLWAVFAPFRSPPSVFLFFSGGGACLFLPLPSLGWCTHWPAFSVVFRPHGSGRLCTRWAGRPLLPGLVLALPAGRLRQAAACGSGLVGWGCSCPFPSAVPVLTFWVVRHRWCQACCGPVCGLRCWCVVCWCGAFKGVRWLASVSPSG